MSIWPRQRYRLRPLPHELLPGSAPAEIAFASNDPDCASAMRRLHCMRYEDCLNHAAAKNWAGFSCERCPIVELRPIAK